MNAGADAARAASSRQAEAHDFVPERPTSPLTALALLSGVGAPGVLRRRQMRFAGAPLRRCFRVGAVRPALLSSATPGGSEETALKAALERFDAAWPRTLRLRSGDCCVHVEALALELTGVPHALSYDPRRRPVRDSDGGGAG